MDEPVFKFAQLNMWTGRLYYPLMNFIQEEQPDLFNTQETLHGDTSLAPSYLTVNDITKDSELSSYSTGLAKKDYFTIKNNNYDLCCSSFFSKKIELISTQSYLILEETESISSHYHSLLHSTVLINDQKVEIFNFHCPVVSGGRQQNPIADEAFVKIANLLKNYASPIIFSGDFNIYRNSRSLNPLKEYGLVNLNDMYQINHARNLFSWKPDESVCHVFINSGIQVHDYSVYEKDISDHKAVIMNFSLNTPTASK